MHMILICDNDQYFFLTPKGDFKLDTTKLIFQVP
jgi:hypothetical protein